MKTVDLHAALCEIDNGRFKKIIHALKPGDSCSSCHSFNLSVKDIWKQYRCRCMPSCVAATLHPDLISYLNWKMGWIRESEHLFNIGVKKPT